MKHALQALWAIVWRELLKFSRQYGRLVSALVRPLLWLAVFAAGFRNVFGVAIVEPYDTYIPYDVYIAPGLIGMVLLFNGMQSSLAMVYDREMGLMRLLLTAPLPRPWILFSKLTATAVLSLSQAAVFVVVAALLGTELPVLGPQTPQVLLAAVCGALMLGSLGLLLSVHIKQLENFAGTMNFVIFPMYFMSTALYPLWKLEESGAQWVYQIARFNPFTHAVEWLRFAMYGKDPGLSPWVVVGTLFACFALASWGYDPQRSFGALTARRAGMKAGLPWARRGASPGSAAAQAEPLWLEWAALAGILAFATWLLGGRGVWGLLLRSDPTGLTLVIIIVFLASTLWCGARSRELQQQRAALERDRQRGDVPGSRGWAADYWQALAVAPRDSGAPLDLLLEQTHGPHHTAWWVNGIQLKLGLLGKVIGFSILALQIGSMQNFDPTQSQDLLKNLTTGLGVALLTTMVGLVGNILLGLQLTRLDRFADALVAEAQRHGLSLPRDAD